MEFSPRRTWLQLHRRLYRNWRFAVTLAALTWLPGSFLMAQGPLQSYGRKAAADKGPRALGLIQLSPKGNKGRLTPIAIMMDGKFYDAGSYKATPVPMALDFDIVYEGFRTGVSQGVFTITQPGQLNHVWIAEGTWLPAGMRAPEKSKKYAAPVIEDKEGPPVLHRRSEKAASDGGADSKDKGKDKDKDQNKDQNKDQQKPAAPPASTSPAPETPKAAAPPETARTAASDETIEDPNRPRLRRGKPDSSTRREPFTTFDALMDAAPGTASTSTGKPGATAKDPAAMPQIVVIPAISDAGGPDPRPYNYEVKPAEEATYRSRMLDLAAAQLRGQTGAATQEAAPTRKKASSGKSTSGKSTSGKSTGKLPQPAFDDVSLRIFDLSNSNEPVLVLSAKTRPSAAGASGSVEEPKEITLIARTNLENELKKLFFSQTDSRHLDVAPRMELIDAVDADGDGRGELLFRRTFDGGSAYAIYRVTADGLWPLFEGTP
ncbi:MAG TPA: hypothetical protein VJX69_13645 [Terriglobales bacterium]|nr:hypothetical protein [Terriglobales bacterium]